LPEAQQNHFVSEIERVYKTGRKAFCIAEPSDGTPAVQVLNLRLIAGGIPQEVLANYILAD